MNFLDDDHFFTKIQFDLLKGKSTTNVNFSVNNFTHENLDLSRKVIDIFLNVKKAFDSVNYEIFLRKLNYAGILGTANNLFKTFLTDRSQKFIVNDI